jgi:hypothetical protein
LIILILVIRIVDCKVCKSSSVRGMQISYDVLFWMVGQECTKKNRKKSRKRNKIEKEKEKHTDYHPVSFYVYFMSLLVYD